MKYLQSVHIPTRQTTSTEAKKIVKKLWPTLKYLKMHITQRFYKFRYADPKSFKKIRTEKFPITDGNKSEILNVNVGYL